MTDVIKQCDVVPSCEECPRYADDCDGDKRIEPTIEHDREWIIGCIKHDGFIHTHRFDKANQIILDALSADAVHIETYRELYEKYVELKHASAEAVSREKDIFRFYYVESIDDYWIGRRVDNFYYAVWHENIGFVWSYSRHLPWGEQSYPTDPKEIPFTEWIIGFMQKHSVSVVRCKDCRHYEKFNYEAPSGYDGWCNTPVIYADGHYTNALHFCSFGERADKGGDADTETEPPKPINPLYMQQSRPHGRLIDADALLDEWLKQKDPTFKCGEMETFFEDMCSKWIDMLHDAPTVEIPHQHYVTLTEDSTIEPLRPHGEWLEKYYDADDREPSHYVCSECRNVWNKAFIPFTWHYCPNCGADMRGDDNDR